ncbi:MAG: acyl-CoA thioesterase [Candidatus Zhuqueibacterota bacterium]
MENFKFSTKLDVTIGDINYGGHLGNDRYLSIFQEARLRYLAQFNFSEMNIGDDTSLIMSSAHVDFKAEVFWANRLIVYVRISELKGVKFMMDYLMFRDDEQGLLVASGYTKMAGFDYKNRQIKKLPPAFVQAIQQYEQALMSA